MRFCLIRQPSERTKLRVHKTPTDESSMTNCGQFASFSARYSRRSVAAIKRLPDCGNCARSKRA